MLSEIVFHAPSQNSPTVALGFLANMKRQGNASSRMRTTADDYVFHVPSEHSRTVALGFLASMKRQGNASSRMRMTANGDSHVLGTTDDWSKSSIQYWNIELYPLVWQRRSCALVGKSTPILARMATPLCLELPPLPIVLQTWMDRASHWLISLATHFFIKSTIIKVCVPRTLSPPALVGLHAMSQETTGNLQPCSSPDPFHRNHLIKPFSFFPILTSNLNTEGWNMGSQRVPTAAIQTIPFSTAA